MFCVYFLKKTVCENVDWMTDVLGDETLVVTRTLLGRPIKGSRMLHSRPCSVCVCFVLVDQHNIQIVIG